MTENEVLRLPEDYSLGNITIYQHGKSEPSGVVDARGVVTFPKEAKVFLDLSQDVCDDLRRIKAVPERLLGDRVSFVGRDLGDADFTQLPLERIRCLVISFCSGIRVEQLRQLGLMLSLEHLNLSHTPIHPIDFSWLLQFPRLKTLDLSGMDVGDHQLVGSIAHLENLEDLRLAHSKITDQGARTCWTMRNLSGIDLSHCKIDDDALTGFDHSAIRSIRLNGTSVSDRGVELIVTAVLHADRQLDYLGLRSCGITDTGLVHLSSLRGLKFLDIGATLATPGGISFLKSALQSCVVAVDPPKG